MSYLKLIILVLIIGLLPVISFASPANMTPAGTVVTNWATASYSNFSQVYNTATTNTNRSTVKHIFGVSTTVIATQRLYVGPGTTVDFTAQVQNQANTNLVVSLTNFFTNFYGTAGAGWTFDFYNAAGTVQITSITLAQGAAQNYLFRVGVPGTASFNETATNQIASRMTSLFGFTRMSNYIGMNGTNYGGLRLTRGKVTIAIVTAPRITLAKRIFITNSATYISLGGGPNDFVPGAEVTYAINFTNRGNTNAYKLNVSDTMRSNYRFVGGSMKYREGFRVSASPADWANGANVVLNPAVAGDNAGAYQCDGTTNAGLVTFTFAQPIPKAGSGTLFFKVYLK